LQTYLEQNEGAGLQHLALKTHNVIATMREMHARSRAGGFEFQAAPGPDYYKKVAQKVVSNALVLCCCPWTTFQRRWSAAVECHSVQRCLSVPGSARA
jgi:hypothetical protein